MEPFCGNEKTRSKLAQGCTSEKLPQKKILESLKKPKKIEATYSCTLKVTVLEPWSTRNSTCINGFVWAATLYITVTWRLPKIFSCLIFFYKVDPYIAVTLYIMFTLSFPTSDCCTQVWLYTQRIESETNTSATLPHSNYRPCLIFYQMKAFIP